MVACTHGESGAHTCKKTPRGTTLHPYRKTPTRTAGEVACKEGQETRYCGKHEEGAANRRVAELVQLAMIASLREYGYDAPNRGIKEDADSHQPGDFCQFVGTGETAVRAALLEFLFLEHQDAAVLVDNARTYSSRSASRGCVRCVPDRAPSAKSRVSRCSHPRHALEWLRNNVRNGASLALDIAAITERVRAQSGFIETVKSEVAKVIVGQNALVERLIIAMLCRGHILIEGVPGLAKTLTVSTLAQAMNAAFVRIQFTPDLLPADITGTTIYSPQDGQFHVRRGPIFANIVLADEINRAPAKVQSALLEAMQERQVSIGGTTFPLDDPFMVLATQNPIEHEGTYALPEAQLDRFMLKVHVTYPTRDEEKAILDRFVAPDATPRVEQVANTEAILVASRALRDVHMDERLRDYIVHLIYATREPAAYRMKELGPLISYGASPRASIYLAQASRAHAFVNGRGFVEPDDVKAVAMDVLRHRIAPTYEAEAENVTAEDLVRRVLAGVEVP